MAKSKASAHDNKAFSKNLSCDFPSVWKRTIFDSRLGQGKSFLHCSHRRLFRAACLMAKNTKHPVMYRIKLMLNDVDLFDNYRVQRRSIHLSLNYPTCLQTNTFARYRRKKSSRVDGTDWHTRRVATCSSAVTNFYGHTYIEKPTTNNEKKLSGQQLTFIARLHVV